MSFLYCAAKQIMLGRVSLTTGETIRISLSSSIYASLIKSSYVPDANASTTGSLRSVFSARAENTSHGWLSVSADVLLSSNEISSSLGVTFFDAGDVVFNSVSSGTVISGILIYQRVTNDTDSLPIAFINSHTVTANGASINVNWGNSLIHIFGMGGESGGGGEIDVSGLWVSTSGSDSNNGSYDAPFRTIYKASQVAQPGDTVKVTPGTYDGGFVTTKDGTADQRITYISTTKWGAKIVPLSPSPNDTAWENQGDYVDIRDFQIDGTSNTSGTAWDIGIFDVGTGGRIIGCWVHHIKAPCTPNGGAGIECYQWQGNLNGSIIGNVVHNIGSVTEGCSFVHGIYHTHTGLIENNLVFNVAGFGIHCWHWAHDITIRNNTIFKARSGGITVGAEPLETQQPADNMIVANNIIYDNVYGINENGLTGTNNLYVANLVFNNTYDWTLQNSVTHVLTIAADPDFVNYLSTGGGDYRLNPTSPAVDAGSPTYASTSDIDGVPRPLGNGPDIGAYESY